jgi:hypothetical protein
MDVMKVDPTSYLPGPLVEGYSSMIWTERFLEVGDFHLTTPKIEETKLLIPEGSLITLRDSREVMLVETHNIEVSKEGIPELKVDGRTLESHLDNRALGNVYQTPWVAYKQYKTSEISAYLLWNFLVNTTNQDPGLVGGIKDPKDAVPGFVVTDSTTIVEAVKEWSLQEGQVYSQFRDILNLGNLGVRGIRPPGTTGNVMTFDTSGGGSRGDVSKVSTPNITGFRLDVYNGLDRTRFQSDREPVIFHYDSGDIDEPKYLLSIKDYKTSAVVVSSIGLTEVWPFTGITPPSTPPTGLDRRVLFVDGGTQGDATLPDFTASVIQKGMVELAKHNRMILFDGAISPISNYKYGADYFLGDSVSVLAQYGFEAEMVIAEYIRTEDHEGDRGYPTLVLSNQEA